MLSALAYVISKKRVNSNTLDSPVVPATRPPTSTTSPTPPEKDFTAPLDHASKRVTKKKFGQYITPQNSPVQPERFQGYHVGADFETFPAEKNTPVAVHAVCSGKLLLKEYASGYGGVIVQSCTLNNQPITVVYGHLKLDSVTKNISDDVHVGQELGVLGEEYSAETDGERKHLHLGFHKGAEIDIKGYVNSPQELQNWLDPCTYICSDSSESNEGLGE
jgi:hypothetical protein